MANTYWHKHPRNFANECSIVRCESAEDRAEAEAENYDRLTRAETLRHIRFVNGENDAWGSNRAFGAIRFSEIPAWREAGY